MYCKECGVRFENENSTVCLECGVKKGNGKKYCDNCGEIKKSENQDVCLNCGKDFKKIFGTSSSQKTKLVTLLLWFFLGGFGVHQFYAGKTGRGILYIVLTLCAYLTCGITGIVVLIFNIIDLIQILTDKFEDGNGNTIVQWT